MLYLEVKVPAPPIVKPGLLYITGCFKLHGYPVMSLIILYILREVAHLGSPYKPMALKKPTNILNMINIYDL